MNILECSSKGDKRFSAFYADVTWAGRTTNIERHYQSSKRFTNKPKKVKGKTPDAVHILSYDRTVEWVLPVSFLTQWYKLLWLMYLDNHPELVNYARGYDDYSDMFRGGSINCQADVIKQYVQEGRESIISETRELIDLLKAPIS